jgi:MFS family permease
MLAYWRVLRGFDRSLILFLAYQASVGFCYFGLLNVLLNLYLLRLGFGLEFIGLLNGAGQLVWAALALPAGAVGRRIGLKEAQVAGLLFTALGMVLLLLVEMLPRGIWAPWLFGWWIFCWIGAALLTVNSVPYVMAVADAETRRYAFPVQTAVSSGMAFAGSLVAGFLPGLLVGVLGGSLADPAPFRLALWLIPPGYILAALVFSRARSVSVAGDAATATPTLPRPLAPFVLLGLVAFLAGTGLGAAQAFFNVYLDADLRVDPARIGTVMGVTQLASVAAALLAPRLLARSGTAATLVLASLGQAVCLALLGGVPSWEAAALGLLGVRATAAIVMPSRNLFSQEMVEPRWRTTTSAVLTIGMGLSWASAAAAGGYLARSIGFGGLFLASAALTAASAVFVLVLERSSAAATRTAAAGRS